MQKRDVVLFDDEVQAREDFYSQERQSAGRKFYIPSLMTSTKWKKV